MRVLVLGSGAREHALVARLISDPEPPDVVCAPGNPGIQQLARIVEVDLTKPEDLVALAASERIDCTIVGPELPLSLGVADAFATDGRLLLGPTCSAARLESSKAFAKDFMNRHSVPTARFCTCDSAADGLKVIRSGEFEFPVVLKADGLAAGKGGV